jgi:hypothetical protein
VAVAELLLIVIFAAVLGLLTRFRWMQRAVPVTASLLLVTGMVWFFIRLRA